MPSRLLAAALVTLAAGPAAAQAPVDDAFFEAKVRPLLAQHCQACHGKDKHKGELRLDTKAGFDKGGETGPAKDLVAAAVRYDGDLKMPPKGKLPDADVAILTAWLKGGAPWPAEKAPAAGGPKDVFDLAGRAKAHWSFQPVKRPAGSTTIDALLLAKLREKRLTFAPPADPRALVRRVYFDLIGLPPTPEQVEAFAADADPRAFEKVVDRLLADPGYGERWGRHWLDLARYAETHGHEFDFDIPDAWRYRDYVVRAFNADLPYNQFLTELLAGDLIQPPRRNPTDGSNESLTATAFWWLGEAKHSPVDSRAEYADRVDNQIDAFGKGVLGLTLACARCHDHKFDPVSTKDYYALFGVMSSSRYHRAEVGDERAAVALLDDLARSRPRQGSEPPASPEAPTPDGAGSGLVAWRAKATAFERFDAGWRQRWDAAGLAFRSEAGDGFPHSGRESAKLAGALRSPTFVIDKPFLAVRAAGEHGKARLVLNGLQLIQNPIYGGLAQPVNSKEQLRWLVFDLRMWKGQPAYLELLDDGPGFVAATEAWFADAPPTASPGTVPPPPTDDATKAMEAKLPAPTFAPTLRDGLGRNERVFVRGNHKTPGAEAPRAFLEAFNNAPLPGPGSGRLELARKVTDPKNPLVARVIVNRLWKHHFGEGLVPSTDDFGYQGQPPTHPELLDWLAAEFVSPSDGGVPWSIKRMHRLMLLSAAYRQGSRATPEQTARATTADPQNKLLHRQGVRRLEAEAIRDAMLAVSGRLDRTVGGPGVLPFLTEHQVGRGKPASGPLDGNGRRSVYLAVRRNFLNPMFVAFDYPTPFTAIGRRTVSNVPAQALVMLNNPFVVQQAELWSRRVLAAGGTADERVGRMYAAAFGRAPTAAERATATAFVADAARDSGRPDDPRAWADLAHALFNAKEFIFID